MKTRKQIISDIAGLASAVFDNGRRGNPRPGCDCEQCFGYCMIDGDEAVRSSFGQHRRVIAPRDGVLDFSE